jgi:hypothetical protein
MKDLFPWSLKKKLTFKLQGKLAGFLIFSQELNRV